MEVAIILSSLAGAATAATINKFPKKNKMPLLGANSQIRAQIETLKIEKEILTKTISRLYSDSSDLTKIQRDKLLSRYQHQLGVILAKIEKLEEASKYPDLGPLGDGLMSLMDQKLSSLDKRLTEISSKISVAQVQLEKPEIKKEAPKKTEEKIETQKQSVTEKPEVVSSESIEDMIKSFAKPAKRFELTTLTEIPVVAPHVETAQKIESVIQPQTVQVQLPQEIVQHQIIEEPKQEIAKQISEVVKPEFSITEPIDIERQVREEPPKLEFKGTEPKDEKKKPKITIPEPEPVEAEDDDDLDSIKREIMKTLSKLEQAEVE